MSGASAESRFSARISAAYEDEIERLQNQVKELVNKNQQTLTENFRLENENAALKNEVRAFKSVSKTVPIQSNSSTNSDDYKLLFQNHQQLKSKYNQLVLDYKQQQQRLKTLEANLKRTQGGSGPRAPSAPLPVTPAVVDNPADKTRIAELEKELAEAYEVIDELEFEMESIGMLESDNERLQSEIQQLQEELQHLKNVDQAGAALSDIKLGGDGGAYGESKVSRMLSDPARRSQLLQKLQVMHNKHNDFFERIKEELDSIDGS